MIFYRKMNLEKKMELLNIVESYWDLLPPELQQLILNYRESQKLIEWRERRISRWMCWQIQGHAQLRLKWFIGPIRCKPGLPKKCKCQPRCFFMEIFGDYWNLDGEKNEVFLGYNFCNAIPGCDDVKNELDYQTNPVHTLSICGLKLF